MEIKIVCDHLARCWMAEWDKESDEGQEIIALFGTNRIPTPFPPGVSGQTVKARLEEKNPEATVTII